MQSKASRLLLSTLDFSHENRDDGFMKGWSWQGKLQSQQGEKSMNFPIKRVPFCKETSLVTALGNTSHFCYQLVCFDRSIADSLHTDAGALPADIPIAGTCMDMPIKVCIRHICADIHRRMG